MSKVQIEISVLSVFCIGKLEKAYNYHSDTYGLAFILKSKWIKMEKQIYKLAKVSDRIQILQLAISRNKRHQNMNRERWL